MARVARREHQPVQGWGHERIVGVAARVLDDRGAGEFDGVLTGAFRRPRIEGHFSGRAMQAFDVTWGDAEGDVVIENSYAHVSKAVINEAGNPFTGHTEFIGGLCAAPLPVMMLMNDTLRVVLVTTHLPLAAVSAAIIGPETLEELEQNLPAGDLELPADLMERVDAIGRPEPVYGFR